MSRITKLCLCLKLNYWFPCWEIGNSWHQFQFLGQVLIFEWLGGEYIHILPCVHCFSHNSSWGISKPYALSSISGVSQVLTLWKNTYSLGLLTLSELVIRAFVESLVVYHHLYGRRSGSQLKYAEPSCFIIRCSKVQWGLCDFHGYWSSINALIWAYKLQWWNYASNDKVHW